MKLSYILGSAAFVGLATAVIIPQLSRDERQSEANKRCLSQYMEAFNSGAKLPPINEAGITHKFLFGGRTESCSANNGAFTWDPNNNLLALYKK